MATPQTVTPAKAEARLLPLPRVERSGDGFPLLRE